MPTNLADSGFVDGDNPYVATQQKAVYTWYESRHSDEEVVDIYSQEWQNRVNDWYNNLDINQLPTETVKSWKSAEEIDFRVFFFAHPVATFSLWRMLQAFYEIDDAVCGKADDAQTKLAGWRAMKPFAYMKSPHVRHKWKAELKRLNKEIKCRLLTGEKLRSRMYDILGGVEKLEVALASVNEDFDLEQGEIEQAEEILNTIRGVIDDRCNLIVKILNVARSDGYIISTEDEAYDESLASSANLLELSTVQQPLSRSDRTWSFPSPLRRDSFNFQSGDIPYYMLAFVLLVIFTILGIKALAP